MKIQIKELLQRRQFRYGGLAAITTILVLGAFILLNMVFSQLNIKFDLTKNQLFTLSEQTEEVLKELDKKVTIYGLYNKDEVDEVVAAILEQYSKRSKRIKVEYVDTTLNPGFIKKYQGNNQEALYGSLIVENQSGKFKVIFPSDLINTGMNPSNPYQQIAESLAVEQRVTAALEYLSSEIQQNVFVSAGHGEHDFSYEVLNQLQLENYKVDQINLLSQDISAVNNDILFVVSPSRDFGKEEVNKIAAFLSEGGRGIFLLDELSDAMPNLKTLINDYGVDIEKGLVIEGDSAYHAADSPIKLLPNLETHDITNTIIDSNKALLYIPGTQARVTLLDNPSEGTEVNPLISTTENSWVKMAPKFETLAMEEGDLQGPIYLAAAVIKKSAEGDRDTKLVVVSNSAFIDPQIPVQDLANLDFIMNSFNWLEGKKTAIRPKSLIPDVLKFTGYQQLLIIFLTVIVLPLIVVGLGISVWVKRKNK